VCDLVLWTAVQPRAVRIAFKALLVLWLLVGVAAAKADTVNVGEFSFDSFNAGTNAFTVSNFSGPFSLFPELPVSTSLTLIGTIITVIQSGTPSSSSLGSIGPGFSQLPVLATDSFSEATFHATLSQTTFTLGDGTTFQADSGSVVATLLPAFGPSLSAGNDFVFLTVTGSPVLAPVPEPASWLLLTAAAPWIIWLMLKGKIRSQHS